MNNRGNKTERADKNEKMKISEGEQRRDRGEMAKGGLRWRRTLTVCRAPVCSISALPVSLSLIILIDVHSTANDQLISSHSTLRAHVQYLIGVPRLSLRVVGGDAHLILSFFFRPQEEIRKRNGEIEHPKPKLPITTSHQSSVLSKGTPNLSC